MPPRTSTPQRDAFLALKRDPNSNDRWIAYWKAWDGFVWAVIRSKLCFAPELWEDCKQDCDAKLYRGIHLFQEEREPAPWLARLVTNVCRDCAERFRGPEGVKIISIDEEGVLDAIEQEFQDVARGNEADARFKGDVWYCVNEALEQLQADERQKTAFRLYYVQGKRLREIAGILQVKESTVNNWPGLVLRRIIGDVKKTLLELGYQPQA